MSDLRLAMNWINSNDKHSLHVLKQRYPRDWIKFVTYVRELRVRD